MVHASEVDEDKIKTSFDNTQHKTEELALQLAEAKAATVSRQYPYSYVLGADQILECDGHIYDKPTSLAASRDQLLELRGRDHRLINGLSILKGSKTQWSHIDIAELRMRDFSERFLDDYLERSGRSILSSVGSYQLEGQGSQLFEHIKGDYFSILGLPLLPLFHYLRQIQLMDS